MTEKNKNISTNEAQKTKDTAKVTEDSEYIYEYDSNREDAIGGGDCLCHIHNEEYHLVPKIFIDYVGHEAFEKWDQKAYEETPTDEETNCTPAWNIIEFIKYFDIPDEIILEAVPGYYDIRFVFWNVELMLKRDSKAYEEFARTKTTITKEEQTEYEHRDSDMWVKWRILELLKKKTDKKSVDYCNKITYNRTMLLFEEFSILDLVENSSLTLEEVKSVVKVNKRLSSSKRRAGFTYNFDLLFEEKAALLAEIEKLEDDPLIPRAAQVDELLRYGYNGELALEGKALETEYGIYIPEGLLPQNNDDLPLEKDFIQYNGRIYWYTETVSPGEEALINISGDVLGNCWGDLSDTNINWETFQYDDFVSSKTGEVYEIKGYDTDFRIMLNTYSSDPNTMYIYEVNRGVTLDKGKDLFGKDALDLSSNALRLFSGDEVITGKYSKLFKDFVKELNASDFILDKRDMSQTESISLNIAMQEGSTVKLTLYKNGYLEYSELNGYGVYLNLQNTELVKKIME